MRATILPFISTAPVFRVGLRKDYYRGDDGKMRDVITMRRTIR